MGELIDLHHQTLETLREIFAREGAPIATPTLKQHGSVSLLAGETLLPPQNGETGVAIYDLSQRSSKPIYVVDFFEDESGGPEPSWSRYGLTGQLGKYVSSEIFGRPRLISYDYKMLAKVLPPCLFDTEAAAKEVERLKQTGELAAERRWRIGHYIKEAFSTLQPWMWSRF